MLLFNDIPIRPVYAMGNLGAYLQAGTEGSGILYIIEHLHWRIFIDIISIYPTTVFVLVLIAFILKCRMYKTRPVFETGTIFLLVFFFISFLPFLKAFNEQVHLTYCMVPLSILLAKGIEDLWFMMGGWRKFVKTFKVIFSVFIIMILADHALNVYAVRMVTDDIYKGITFSANWFIRNVPNGTPVVTNAHHLEDVRFYSGGHIDPWGAPGGIPDQRKWMNNPSDLQNLLDDSRQKGKEVYFFDVEIEETPGQRGLGRRLFYVKDRNVEMEDLGIVYTIQARYPFLDPLKYLIPVGQMTWPGPPDLEFDFYRGPALDGTPFYREVHARYHLYKATGDKVSWASGHPQLVEENFHNFNLILYQNRIYGIPQSEGAFEIERVKKDDYSQSFEADSVGKVKESIRKIYEFQQTSAADTRNISPQLIEENFHNFNLILYQNRIYGIPQSEGAFEIERVKKDDYSQSFEADSVGKVKESIRKIYEFQQTSAADTRNISPQLIEENFHNFNLILYQNRIYGIPQSEGAFEIERVKKDDYSQSFEADSVVR